MSKLIDNSVIANVSNVTTSYSVTYDASHADNIAFAIVNTPVSGGTGTLTFNASEDGVNFAPVPGFGAVSISTSKTTIFYQFQPAYKFLQIAYSASSHGMNLVITVAAKSNTIIKN
jgi:hypothetical protein